MNKDVIDRKVKVELDFFKIYAIFVIGLVTGDVNLFLKYVSDKSNIILLLLMSGILVLILIFAFLIRSFLQLTKFTKNK